MKKLVVDVVIPGDPLSKQRPRFTMNKNGTVYTPKHTKEAEEYIAWQIKAAHQSLLCESELAYAVHADFHQENLQRRDLDNMVKLVCDACTGIVWEDDSQVWEIVAHKTRGVGKEDCRTELKIYTIGSLKNAFEVCELCGKKYRTYPSWKKVGRSFCSVACRGLSQRLGKQAECQNCHEQFYIPLLKRISICIGGREDVVNVKGNQTDDITGIE